MLIAEFSKDQMDCFNAFEHVRLTCEYNMLDPQARRETELTKQDWIFVKNNYKALKAQHESSK